MSAFDDLKEEIRVEIGASDIFNATVRKTAHAAACRAVDQVAAEIRAEVLREAAAQRDNEVVDWLLKKAREYRSTGSTQHRLQAEAIEAMADKISRGAVR